MSSGTYISIVLGIIIATLAIFLLIALLGSRKTRRRLNQTDILTDELERHKKENMRLRAELKRLNSMTNLFFASMIRLTAKLNPLEIANETRGLLANYLDPEKIAIFVYDEKGKRLNIITQQGLDENWIPKIIYKLGEGKVGRAAATRFPVSRSELEFGNIKEPYPVFDPDICYPLVYQDRLYGVIAISIEKISEREKNLLGVVAMMTAVALNNTRSFESIQTSAITDPLTKLYNIAHFKDRLQEEIKRAQKFQHDLSIIIIDLDNFKDYNDTFGHHAGDQLLIKLAQIFRHHFDETDTVARYGGDEFIVMCPEIKKQEAVRIAGNLLQDLQLYDFTREGQKNHPSITFSAGVSSYPDDSSNYADLIKMADEALYEAKRAGRNNVRGYKPKIEKI